MAVPRPVPQGSGSDKEDAQAGMPRGRNHGAVACGKHGGCADKAAIPARSPRRKAIRQPP